MDGMKNQKRAAIRKKSSSLSEGYRKRASEAMCDTLLASELYAAAETVMCYLSMSGEPSTDRMIEKMLADGKRVCIPLCVDKEAHLMVAKEYNSETELVAGAYGIMEPRADAPEVAPWDIDLVIAPCVSCTRDGYRMGHGAGYYDRYLVRTDCPAVALCFEVLLSDELPVDDYDVRMDAVISEEELYIVEK